MVMKVMPTFTDLHSEDEDDLKKLYLKTVSEKIGFFVIIFAQKKNHARYEISHEYYTTNNNNNWQKS